MTCPICDCPARSGVGTPVTLSEKKFGATRLPPCCWRTTGGVWERAGTVEADTGTHLPLESIWHMVEVSATGTAYDEGMVLMFKGITTGAGATALPCDACDRRTGLGVGGPLFAATRGLGVADPLFAVPDGTLGSTSPLLEMHCDADAGATQSVPG